MKLRKIFAGLLVAVFVFGGYLIVSKSYPVALVNSRPIALKFFEKDLSASVNYYKKLLETYRSGSSGAFSLDSKTRNEIKRLLLEKLIEESLIRSELEKRLSEKEIKDIVGRKIEEAAANADLEKGAEILYGFSLEEFREKVLAPQAEREILEARLFLEKGPPVGGFDDWLKKEKAAANVMIFIGGFSWNGEGVVVK